MAWLVRRRRYITYDQEIVAQTGYGPSISLDYSMVDGRVAISLNTIAKALGVVVIESTVSKKWLASVSLAWQLALPRPSPDIGGQDSWSRCHTPFF